MLRLFNGLRAYYSKKKMYYLFQKKKKFCKINLEKIFKLHIVDDKFSKIWLRLNQKIIYVWWALFIYIEINKYWQTNNNTDDISRCYLNKET